jgi:hypothetical protein
MAAYFFHSKTGFLYIIGLYYVSMCYIVAYCIIPAVETADKKCSRIIYDFLVLELDVKRSHALLVILMARLSVFWGFISGIAYYLHLYYPVFYDNDIIWGFKILIIMLFGV